MPLVTFAPNHAPRMNVPRSVGYHDCGGSSRHRMRRDGVSQRHRRTNGHRFLSTLLGLGVLLAVPLPGVAAESLRDLILKDENLSLFRLALARTGLLEGILDDTSDPDRVYTVLAPTNDAILKNQLFDTYMKGIHENPPRWKYHIERATQHHILDSVAMTNEQLFDKKLDAHYSLVGPIEVSHFFGVIGGAKIVQPDIKAENGYLHVIDKVIEANFFEHSFASLTEQIEFGPDWKDRVSLKTIVDFVDGYHVYNHLLESGQTHVGCRIRALNRIGLFYLRQCINQAEEGTIKYNEFLNASWVDRTIHDFLEYTLIDRNIYNRDIPRRHQELIRATNNCSDMWVTKDLTGQLCFNDGCVVATPNSREFLANNGYGYVVDKCIVCSGVSMLVDYASIYTNYNMKDISQFLISSEWNLRNLSLSVGDGGLITLLAAADPGWDIFNIEDMTKLSTDKWKPHQWDLLRHNILQGVYQENDFKHLWQNVYNQSAYNLTTLSGQNVLFDYDPERDMVMVDGGDLWYPNIKGVDGLMHFITKLPVPKSVTHSVYDIGKENGNFSSQITLIDTVFLDEDMNRLLPLTAMFAPNDDWEGKIFEIEDIGKIILENHLIENLAWCEDLVALEGEKVDTLNGQLWTISVNEDGMPCFESKVPGGESYRSCVIECDILARNGIVHYVDKVILFETPETLGPIMPSVPTMSRPSSPSYFKPPSPTPGQGLDRPTFFGNNNPAYAPIDNRAQASGTSFESRPSWSMVLLMALIALALGCFLA